MSYLLTFDVGTTAVKTSLFDTGLTLKAAFSAEYTLVTGPETAELPPETYWKGISAGVSAIFKEYPLAADIKMITITTQGETLIPVDREGRALGNALVWIDARAREECALLSGKIDSDTLYRHTGLGGFTPAMPVCKLLWFRLNKPALYKQTAQFLLLEDYLILRLSGVYASNPALLGSTGYFDINCDRYWETVLDAAGVDIEKLPPVYPSGKIIGAVNHLAAAETGLLPGTPVCTGAMDQVASALGSGNYKKGIVTETTGTCLAAAATLDKPDYDNPQRPTYYRHFGDTYLIIAYNPTGAIILKWLKDELMPEFARDCAAKGLSVYAEMSRLAEAAPVLSGGLILSPHFDGKLTPEIDSHARGVLYGLSLAITRGCIIRAVFEGVGYMLRENLEYLERCHVSVERIRSLGGGAGSAVWNSIKADITGKDIAVMEQPESTSLGAAMIGALAAGFYHSLDEIGGNLKIAGVYHPSPVNKQLYDAGYEKYLTVYRRLAGMA